MLSVLFRSTPSTIFSKAPSHSASKAQGYLSISSCRACHATSSLFWLGSHYSMDRPMSEAPKSTQLFQCLITCYSVRQQLFDNLTPYSVACLLHIFKVQLGNDVGTAEKQRFLNPMRCLFDKTEMEEIEERIKKGHAIILWGKDLELMTQLLHNPEPDIYVGWPQNIDVAISHFVLAGSGFDKNIPLLGQWDDTEARWDKYRNVTTPEPGILLHDMTGITGTIRTTANKKVLELWYPWSYVDSLGNLVHPGGSGDLRKPECEVDYSAPYIQLHEMSSISRLIKCLNTVVWYTPAPPGLQLSLEMEGLDTASPTLEDTLEMRRAWSEGKEAYLQSDWWRHQDYHAACFLQENDWQLGKQQKSNSNVIPARTSKVLQCKAMLVAHTDYWQQLS